VLPEYSEDQLWEISRALMMQVNGSYGSMTPDTAATQSLALAAEDLAENYERQPGRRAVAQSKALWFLADEARSAPEMYAVHRKGFGVVCSDPGGVQTGDMVIDFLGEMYPPWAWMAGSTRSHQLTQHHAIWSCRVTQYRAFGPANSPDITPLAPTNSPNVTPLRPANSPDVTPLGPTISKNVTPLGPANSPDITPLGCPARLEGEARRDSELSEGARDARARPAGVLQHAAGAAAGRRRGLRPPVRGRHALQQLRCAPQPQLRPQRGGGGSTENKHSTDVESRVVYSEQALDRRCIFPSSPTRTYEHSR